MTPEQIDNKKKQQEALAARVADLKKFEGKTFVPKNLNPRFPNQRITVLSYAGIGKLSSGESAHLFKVESKSPGNIWTPPATKFLEEHDEVKVQSAKPASKGII